MLQSPEGRPRLKKCKVPRGDPGLKIMPSSEGRAWLQAESRRRSTIDPKDLRAYKKQDIGEKRLAAAPRLFQSFAKFRRETRWPENLQSSEGPALVA